MNIPTDHDLPRTLLYRFILRIFEQIGRFIWLLVVVLFWVGHPVRKVLLQTLAQQGIMVPVLFSDLYLEYIGASHWLEWWHIGQVVSRDVHIILSCYKVILLNRSVILQGRHS